MVTLTAKVNSIEADGKVIPIHYEGNHITHETYVLLAEVFRGKPIDFLCSVGVNPHSEGDNLLAQIYPFLPLLRDGVIPYANITAARTLQRANEEREFLKIVNQLANQMMRDASKLFLNETEDKDLFNILKKLRTLISELGKEEKGKSHRKTVKAKLKTIQEQLIKLLRDEKFKKITNPKISVKEKEIGADNEYFLNKIKPCFDTFDFHVKKQALWNTFESEIKFITDIEERLKKAFEDEFPTVSIPVVPWSAYVGMHTQVTLDLHRLKLLRELEGETPYDEQELIQQAKNLASSLEDKFETYVKRKNSDFQSKPYNTEQDLIDIKALEGNSKFVAAADTTTEDFLDRPEHPGFRSRAEDIPTRVGFPLEYLRQATKGYLSEEGAKYFGTQTGKVIIYPGKITPAIETAISLVPEDKRPIFATATVSSLFNSTSTPIPIPPAAGKKTTSEATNNNAGSFDSAYGRSRESSPAGLKPEKSVPDNIDGDFNLPSAMLAIPVNTFNPTLIEEIDMLESSMHLIRPVVAAVKFNGGATMLFYDPDAAAKVAATLSEKPPSPRGRDKQLFAAAAPTPDSSPPSSQP